MNSFELKRELFQQKVRARIDSRIVACRVDAAHRGDRILISGFVMYPQVEVFVRSAATEIFGNSIDLDLTVLTTAHPPTFKAVAVPAASFWARTASPGYLDMLNQAFYGSVVRAFFEEKKYTYAQHPDGYVGYVPTKDLVPVTEDVYLRWKNGPCAVLKTPLQLNGVELAPGVRLAYERGSVRLLDGTSARVPSGSVHLVDPHKSGIFERLMRHAESFNKTPYLWGGKTEAGIDCSGFTQSVFQQERIFLPRDASMQAYVGEVVGIMGSRELIPGDLCFFMNKHARVFHVAIYAGNNSYVHSCFNRGIIRSSFSRSGQNYIVRFGQNFVFGRRVHIL